MSKAPGLTLGLLHACTGLMAVQQPEPAGTLKDKPVLLLLLLSAEFSRPAGQQAKAT